MLTSHKTIDYRKCGFVLTIVQSLISFTALVLLLVPVEVCFNESINNTSTTQTRRWSTSAPRAPKRGLANSLSISFMLRLNLHKVKEDKQAVSHQIQLNSNIGSINFTKTEQLTNTDSTPISCRRINLRHRFCTSQAKWCVDSDSLIAATILNACLSFALFFQLIQLPMQTLWLTVSQLFTSAMSLTEAVLLLHVCIDQWQNMQWNRQNVPFPAPWTAAMVLLWILFATQILVILNEFGKCLCQMECMSKWNWKEYNVSQSEQTKKTQENSILIDRT